jgi:hypothetical protein
MMLIRFYERCGAGTENQKLQTQKRFVPLPDEPGDGEDPEPDSGGVGREDLAVVLRGVAGLYDRYGLVLGQTGRFEPALGRVVKITVPTVASLPRQTCSPVSVTSGGV